MARDNTSVSCGSLGGLWIIGWLFTIGYLKLGFWMGALALIVWPYFLGGHFADATAPDTEKKTSTSYVETIAITRSTENRLSLLVAMPVAHVI